MWRFWRCSQWSYQPTPSYLICILWGDPTLGMKSSSLVELRSFGRHHVHFSLCLTAKIRWLQHLFSGSSNKTLSRVKRIIPSFLFQSPRPWVVLYGHPPKSQARLGAWINFSCLALMAPFCVSRILSTSLPRGKSWECLVQGPSHSLPMRETIFRSPIHKNGSIVSLGFSSKYHPSGPSGVSKKEAATKHGLTNRTFLYLTGEFQWSLTMFRPTVVAGLPMCCGSILMFAGSRHVYWKSLIFRVGSCHSSRSLQIPFIIGLAQGNIYIGNDGFTS